MFSIVLVGLVLSACKSQPERPAELEEPPADQVEPELPPPPPPPPPAAAKEPQPAADSSDTPSAVELPVAEDFQAETAAAIVRSNYRHELDNLESEMRADGD